jgi:hypothetical protein
VLDIEAAFRATLLATAPRATLLTTAFRAVACETGD